MAHIRKRFAKSIILKNLGFSPIVGILGHRQVGKTTLLEDISKKYLTLDDHSTLEEISLNPSLFLKNHKADRVAIDECQLEPKLFPALKEFVRKHKQPGRFLLSGSVRFTSKKSIRESLTGRIVNCELLPFTVSELNHFDLPTASKRLLELSDLSTFKSEAVRLISDRKKLNKDIEVYFEKGGLPGVCFIRDGKIRNERLNEQLRTILDRDIRQIYHTTIPYYQIIDFLKILAETQGEVINFSEIRNRIGISPATQKKLLYALEATFLIRLIPAEGSANKMTCFLEDQGEAKLLFNAIDPQKEFESFIYRHVRAEFFYNLGETFQFFTYQTRNNAKMPIAVKTNKGILGFMPISTDEPTKSNFASANSFLRYYNNSKVVFITRSNNIQTHDSRTITLPACLFV